MRLIAGRSWKYDTYVHQYMCYVYGTMCDNQTRDNINRRIKLFREMNK